ncbi:MAG: hypothetical protein ABI792_00400 [bacterium]
MKKLLLLALLFAVSCNKQDQTLITSDIPYQGVDTSNKIKVYFANASGYSDNDEPHFVDCFIAGYESGGASWKGMIKRDSFVSSSEINGNVLPFMQDSGYILMLRNVGVSVYSHLTVDSFYRQGIQVITCSGSNYPFQTSMLPLKNIIVCGAGDTGNVTSYSCEFYSWHPFNEDPFFYQSYAHAYIAGQIVFIKDYLKCSWWEARYRARVTGSENNIYHTYNGFGKINIYNAIRYQGAIPNDPYM